MFEGENIIWFGFHLDNSTPNDLLDCFLQFRLIYLVKFSLFSNEIYFFFGNRQQIQNI